jgi:transposase InsO family protein
MNTITQTMRFRQALIEYSFKYGVTKAAIKYRTKPYEKMCYPGQRVQTDNGAEFTKRFCAEKSIPTLFEKTLEKHGIQYKLIRPYAPRHNGKVERSHRKDNEYFYATHI